MLEDWGVDFSRPLCGIVSKNDERVRNGVSSLVEKGYQTIAITTRNDMCEISLFDGRFILGNGQVCLG